MRKRQDDRRKKMGDWNEYYFPQEVLEQADAVRNSMAELEGEIEKLAEKIQGRTESIYCRFRRLLLYQSGCGRGVSETGGNRGIRL